MPAKALVQAAVLALALLSCGLARAHAPTFAVYSKYEATTWKTSVAFVFAFDKMPVLSLLARDGGDGSPSLADIPRYRTFFSKYLFDRFSVDNGGVACSHPGELDRFAWDERTNVVLAVTKFVCPSELTDLTIRSLVTHDMPYPHELVGDLQHGSVLVRHFFSGDDTEARIALASLPASGVVEPRRPRSRTRFSYVSVPDQQRRYEALAFAELGIDAPLHAPSATEKPAAPPNFLSFVGQGIVHIFTGFDHVLFILTLVVVARDWKKLALIVTSFTAAHSVTLALATLGVVAVPGRVVEPLIAFTVLVVAVDAMLRPKAPARAAVAFAFGLVHGLGLSSALRDLGLTGRAVVSPLLGFNLGVEVGQLLIVGPALAIVMLLRRNEASFDKVRRVLCASVAIVAVFWIVVRVREALVG